MNDSTLGIAKVEVKKGADINSLMDEFFMQYFRQCESGERQYLPQAI